MEFDEVRLYQAGDDVRLIDWQVTARTGKPHTKLFREEREQPVFLLLDLSPSLFFASQGQLKARLAACVLAQIAWQTLARQDRVALWYAGTITQQECAPKEHRPALLRMLGHLLQSYHQELAHFRSHGFEVTHPPPLRNLLERLVRLQRPGSSLWIFSDFQSFAEEDWRLCRRLAKRSQLQTVCVLDPLEQQMPWRGEVLFQQGSQRLALDWEEQRERKFEEQFHAWREAFQQRFRPLRVPVYWLQTTDTAFEFQTSISSTASL